MGIRSKKYTGTVSFFLAVLLISSYLFSKGYAQNIAPEFTLIDIDGEEFSTADFKGTTVILTFVASRVITCKMQVFVLNNVSKYFGDDVIIVLIGVSNETLWVGGDTDEQLGQFREGCGFEGIVARDTEGVAEQYNVTFVPTTFIIDQEGYIRHKHVGAIQSGSSVLLQELHVVVPEFSSTAILLFALILGTLATTAGARRFCQQKDDSI
jgi:peroxiredoxin